MRVPLVLLWLCACSARGGHIPPPPNQPSVLVHKCCERSQLMVEARCRHVNETTASLWAPVFTDEQGHDNVQVGGFRLVIGLPSCGARQQWPIYHYRGSTDKLVLLPDGRLRHYTLHAMHHDLGEEQALAHDDITQEDHRFYDYQQGQYCLDKIVQDEGRLEAQFAIVCVAEVVSSWQSADFVLRRIIDPACHAIAIACYLAVAVVHFVLPQLRDLVGNIITSLSVCFLFTQFADVVRIFTEFASPTTFLVADGIMYVSLLGAFFWLNSLGYYIWKTFKSRNVFLRITDGRKYCYYSLYVWGCTLLLAAVALFAHFILDMPDNTKAATPLAQGSIGWLGTAVFFTPIAFTVLVNIFFYLTTVQIISRMSTYGRIHHKMKYSFHTFLKLFLVMGVGWLFLLLSWMPYNGMFYCYIVSNALQAPFILYVSVLSQARVRFLLRKACCYDKCVCPCCRPDENDAPEWGEEMMSMNR